MSTRRNFLIAIGSAFLAPTPARSASPNQVPKVGYLLLAPIIDPPTAERRAFLRGLRELGYVPGKNIEIVYSSAEGEADFLDAACADLLKKRVDVIAVAGAPAAFAAQKATVAVPIVIMAIGDIMGVGLADSLSQPTGNLTGVNFMSSDLASKRVQLAQEIRPGLSRMAVLWDARNRNARAESAIAMDAAAQLGVKAFSVDVANDSELPSAFGRVVAGKAQILYVAFEGGLVARFRSAIAEFGLRQRVPVISGWSFLTEAGGLLSYGADIPSMFHRSAYYVHRILKGAKPADLPIEQPTKFDFVVNRKTARALEITIPQSILVRADRVIE